MARGYFRTDKTMCVCCGARGQGVKTYRRGSKNTPTYDCEKCFDKYATDEEKAIKTELLASENGVVLKHQKSKV